ncbi:MAG: gamma-glutamylcyclotransferase family protein [Chloroflexota bacterium]
MTEEIWYFAYGSNLNLGQMMTRIGEWSVSKRAKLTGHKLTFDFPSERWGGLTANIVKTSNAEDNVWGVVYRISPEKLEVLTHRYERVPPQGIKVDADGVKITAKVYVFKPGKPGRPPDAYLNVMLAGLRQHGYPDEVIETVKRTATNL